MISPVHLLGLLQLLLKMQLKKRTVYAKIKKKTNLPTDLVQL